MSIEPINHYSLTNPASVYDEEALTALELAARTAGKVNEVIKDNEAFKEQHRQENVEFIENINNQNAEFVSNIEAKFDSLNSLVRSRMGNRFVYDFTDTAGTHPSGETAPIFININGKYITIKNGVYHFPAGNTIVSEWSNVIIPEITSATMLYLVRTDAMTFVLKTESEILFQDIIFCGVYFTSKTDITFHNEALFSRYALRVENRIGIQNVLKDIFYNGYVHSGKIELDTVNKTIRVVENLIITVPRYSGFITVPAGDTESYTLADGDIGSFMVSSPYGTNQPSTLKYGLIPQIMVANDNNIYLGAFGYGHLIGNNFSDNVQFVINSVLINAGDIKSDSNFVSISTRKAIREITEDNETNDIILPSTVNLTRVENMTFDMRNLSKYKDKNYFTFDNDRQFFGLSIDPQSESNSELVTVKRANIFGERMETKQVTFSFFDDPQTESAIKIMLLGDGLIDNNFVAKSVSDRVSTYKVELLGTQGTGRYKHEGRKQWSWDNYVNSNDYAGKSNPFRTNGSLSIADYANNNGIHKIDFLFVCLGANDVNLGEPWTDENTLNDKIESAISNAKIFLNAFINFYSGISIGLILPATPLNSRAFVNIDPVLSHYAIQKLNQRYIDEFDNGAFDENVKIIPWNFFTTDNDLGDSVHPNSSGAYKLSELIYAHINSIKNGG